MKKLIISMAILAFFFGSIYSQTITITNPNSESKWMIGKDCNVTWTKLGSMDSNAKIRLWDSKMVKMLKINNSTPNNGSYVWTIPGSVTAGDYIIRVKTADGDVYDDSVIFSIIENPIKAASSKGKDNMKPLYGKIEIIKPSISSKWKEGTLNKIQWKETSEKTSALKIDLYSEPGGKFEKTLATILPSNVNKIVKGRGKASEISSYNWFIPKGTYKPPGKYRIKMRRVGGNAFGMSDVFRIEIEGKVSRYKIYGVVNNQCKRKFWSSNKTTDHLKIQADKVPCKNNSTTDAWVGYEYRLMHEKQSDWVGDVFRSFVYFDVSHLQGKGVVLSAKLYYEKADVTSGESCKLSIYKVNSKWTNPFNTNTEFISSDPKNIDLKAYLWSWIGHPNDNYGLMFIGPDESFQHITAKCRSILTNIYIEVEFLE